MFVFVRLFCDRIWIFLNFFSFQSIKAESQELTITQNETESKNSDIKDIESTSSEIHATAEEVTFTYDTDPDTIEFEVVKPENIEENEEENIVIELSEQLSIEEQLKTYEDNAGMNANISAANPQHKTTRKFIINENGDAVAVDGIAGEGFSAVRAEELSSVVSQSQVFLQGEEFFHASEFKFNVSSLSYFECNYFDLD